MTPRQTKAPAAPIEPPDHLPEAVAEVWTEIVSSNDLAMVDRSALETFCTLMARLREARKRIEDEGMVVKDPRGRVIPHPALTVERSTAEQIRAWGDRFAPLVKPVRKKGYMADATARSIADALHLQSAKFAGPIAALKTLAWQIDEAQRDSAEAIQKAMITIVPNYLKACAELQITPASIGGAVATKPAAVPEPAESEPKPGGGSVSSLQDRARARRAGVGS